MNLILLINNISSAALVVICWWLVHQNAQQREPFGRTIAVGYMLLALSVLANILFRNVQELMFVLPMSLLLSKVFLTFTLGLVAIRLHLIYPPR